MANNGTNNGPSIAILGGGILGLSAAYCCLKQKLGNVVIYERDDDLGGLAGTFEVCGTKLEKYHHFICKSDKVVLNQMADFGLEKLVNWADCRMGLFVHNKPYSFTTPADLLHFDALEIISRLRLGAAMLSLKFKKDWKPLESVPAAAWLKKWAGKRSYEVVWSHLMKSKFDIYENKIPLSWLWARTNRRSGSKRRGSSLEHFGYVKGSFAVLIDEYVKRIRDMGGEILTGCAAKSVSRNKEGQFTVESESGERMHKAVISTIPLPSLLSVATFFTDGYKTRLSNIKYQTVLNMVVVLKRNLTDFFWLNIGDGTFPFPGIIEFSHLRDIEDFGGRSILYLPNYLPADHKLNQLSDDQLLDVYLQSLSKIVPDLEREWVDGAHVFRHPYADPYYTLDYSKLLPDHRSPYKRLFVFNTAQIYPITRNVSNSILFGQNAAALLKQDMGAK
ncbi:MAG: NAD(P)/FAD-dependent oxidoreductase [Candidatus Coatesbacteria bacterium]|nr:NAD(P)/FAD-dependent oxidoreductase [Candidatus Coatesbacteria bacterium]